MLTIHILNTGFTTSLEALLLRGGKWRTVHLPVLTSLIHHPAYGWGLFDTGYSQPLMDITRKMPWYLQRVATPFIFQPEWAVSAQLPRFGLTVQDIRWVFLSHFHGDHHSSLPDFAHAQLIANRMSWQALKDLAGLAAVRKAFFPMLVPPSMVEKAHWIEHFTGQELTDWGKTHDLWGDGLALAVPLPGHAIGQMGLFLPNTQRGPVLLGADAAWLSRAYRELRPPSRLTNFIADDPAALRRTLHTLHDFALARPDVSIVLSHCSESQIWGEKRESAGQG
jgi:glyoxylase-like metal-dependent hydrolase (beta-lactamase superfamily II)